MDVICLAFAGERPICDQLVLLLEKRSERWSMASTVRLGRNTNSIIVRLICRELLEPVEVS